ncbi:MAG TPA: bifunctional phosphopantothenoylcysteine decarboxylase/phosphopantothenate--cysteine ligase CoaBC [Fimbriimonas sp.]|nr:bifunctional phosphopantothenoylcysteine decarboxylase/phosphopantothenate--cysteine ligase CoaBC [Fimbriimonas sp.]
MNIVLGVSGSVAAYRACDLARELMRQGHTVRVCLTDAAQKFVSVELFEALTGQPCLQDTFEEPERGRMAHIEWARSADLILVVPATANTINKLAHGIGTDMLTTLAVATNAPLMIAPAMNPEMYIHPITQNSLNALKAMGATIIEPETGEVACGEFGQGKLAAIDQIVEVVQKRLAISKRLEGKTILVTSGPTQEPIDDVRYISNHSSGKMGSAIAFAALEMGAKVIVVAGPQTAAVPANAKSIRVQTALEMEEEVLNYAPQADFIVGVAAVADYRIESPTKGKLRRSSESLQLTLVPNPDIIAGAAKAAPNAVTIGFAAEPTSDLEVAKAKLQKKGLRAIAANDVSEFGIGFGSNNNSLTLVFDDGSNESSGVRSKLECARWFWNQVLDHQG